MEFSITVTDFLSILSLVIATSSFVISYFLWKEDKPRVKLSYYIGEIISWNPAIWKTHDVLNISVINKWKRPVTISKQVALSLWKWKYLLIVYDKYNYLWDIWSQNERINEFSSINILINIDWFKINNININEIKGLTLSDTLWNNYFIKFKNEDKLKLKEIIT